jgi:hypothetical protein
MSLFGAARLYVASANRIERDFAPLDIGSVALHRDGAWTLWAQMGASANEVDARPAIWRVQPGPVRLAHRRSARD